MATTTYPAGLGKLARLIFGISLTVPFLRTTGAGNVLTSRQAYLVGSLIYCHCSVGGHLTINSSAVGQHSKRSISQSRAHAGRITHAAAISSSNRPPTTVMHPMPHHTTYTGIATICMKDFKDIRYYHHSPISLAYTEADVVSVHGSHLGWMLSVTAKESV